MATNADIDLEYWRKRLEQERADRVTMLDDEANNADRFGSPLDSSERGFSNHLGEESLKTFQNSLDLTLQQKIENEIELIDEALGRINDGSFGICAITNQPIEPERLEVIPWTRFSSEGQRIFEHRHSSELLTNE